MNRKVGQASRLSPSAPPMGRAVRTRSLGRRDACPTLLMSRFRGSKRENEFRRILSWGERAGVRASVELTGYGDPMPATLSPMLIMPIASSASFAFSQESRPARNAGAGCDCGVAVNPSGSSTRAASPPPALSGRNVRAAGGERAAGRGTTARSASLSTTLTATSGRTLVSPADSDLRLPRPVQSPSALLPHFAFCILNFSFPPKRQLTPSGSRPRVGS